MQQTSTTQVKTNNNQENSNITSDLDKLALELINQRTSATSNEEVSLINAALADIQVQKGYAPAETANVSGIVALDQAAENTAIQEVNSVPIKGPFKTYDEHHRVNKVNINGLEALLFSKAA